MQGISLGSVKADMRARRMSCRALASALGHTDLRVRGQKEMTEPSPSLWTFVLPP